jgi:hypothetical protein
MASNDLTRLTSTASGLSAGWYFINGAPLSLEDAEVLAVRGLPNGDYRVASDFVRKLRAITAIEPRRYITFTKLGPHGGRKRHA